LAVVVERMLGLWTFPTHTASPQTTGTVTTEYDLRFIAGGV
jgi:hypothetical protein